MTYSKYSQSEFINTGACHSLKPDEDETGLNPFGRNTVRTKDQRFVYVKISHIYFHNICSLFFPFFF